MAYPAFTGGVANIKPASFNAVYVKDAASSHYQTLGSISGGVMNVQNFSSLDSLGRNRSNNALHFTAKCTLKQSSVTEIETLDHLCDGTNGFLFKLSDAQAVTTSQAYTGWVEVAATQVGVKAKLVADGTPENNQVVELEWEGTILVSDANQTALFNPTLAATSFAATGESNAAFLAWGTYTATTDGGSPTNGNIKPCGISTVQLDLAGGSSPVTFGPVQNPKISIEMLSTKDSRLRHLPCALDINIEYDVMATANADLLLLAGGTASQNIQGLACKLTITMLNGMVITLDDKVGIETNFEVSGDMDKNRVIRFTHKGKVLQSTIADLVS